jgi:hypothetical protein
MMSASLPTPTAFFVVYPKGMLADRSVSLLRQTANLSNPIKLMLPVQSSLKKYIPSRFTQIKSISPAVSRP